MIQQSRRGFIGGFIGIIAAPAIVKAASLMPVKLMEPFASGGLVRGPGTYVMGQGIITVASPDDPTNFVRVGITESLTILDGPNAGFRLAFDMADRAREAGYTVEP